MCSKLHLWSLLQQFTDALAQTQHNTHTTSHIREMGQNKNYVRADKIYLQKIIEWLEVYSITWDMQGFSSNHRNLTFHHFSRSLHISCLRAKVSKGYNLTDEIKKKSCIGDHFTAHARTYMSASGFREQPLNSITNSC